MCLNMIYLYKKKMYVPCGQCIECKKQYSFEWSNRIALEAMNHDENSFITLTYDNYFCAKNNFSLVRKDLQDFIKRLRSRLSPIKIRYFYCGEYGASGGRPHYHMILFGFDFFDKRYFMNDSRGNPIYRSALLEDLWPFGFSSIGSVTLRTCLYTAKYMQKCNGAHFDKTPPFVGMSLKPGVGFWRIDEKMLETGCYYFNGKSIPLPRYFIRVLERDYLERVEELKRKHINLDHAGMKYDQETGEVQYYNNATLPDDYLDVVLSKKRYYENKYGITLDNAGRIV